MIDIKKNLKKVVFWDNLSCKIRLKIKKILKIDNYKLYNPKKENISDIDIGIFFAENIEKVLLLNIWIKLFQYVSNNMNIIFFVKDKDVFLWLKKNTNFIVIFYRNLNDLLSFYSKYNIKVILYLTNSDRNFHSLIYNKALHVYIHTKDTRYTFSNQVKVYDYIFISSNFMLDNFKLNLIKLDEKKFIKIGYPELDFIEKSVIKGNAMKSGKVFLSKLQDICLEQKNLLNDLIRENNKVMIC